MPIYKAPITDFEILQKYYRSDILELTEKYGVTNVRVFGSVARGEATENSDLDLLVTLPDKISFLTFSGIENKLSDVTNTKVQLVDDKGLSPFMAPYILGEARLI